MESQSEDIKSTENSDEAKVSENTSNKVGSDDTEDGSLDENRLDREKFIKKLKDGEYKCINVMTGAGISVSSGIPDFRSPKIGLYAVLKEKYDMDDPSDIFNITTFMENPQVFYDFSKEFNWDEYDPTPTHYFIGFLHKKNLLDNYITQNIDCLEYKAGIPKEKIVAAHGDLSGAECPKCRQEQSLSEFKRHVKEGTIYYCEKCAEKGNQVPIKPTVVFFGENLPMDFFTTMQKIPNADCNIVIGSSLVVSPFNFLPTLIPNDAAAVTINMEPISHIPRLTSEKNALFLEGKCDEVIDELIKDLGWKEEFDEFVAEVKATQEAKI